MFERVKRLLGLTSQLSPLQEQIQQKRQQLELKMLESSLSIYDQLLDPLDYPWEDTPDFFAPFGVGPQGVPVNMDNQGRGEQLPIYLNWYQLKLIRDNSRKLCGRNEFAINAIENRINYVVGSGFRYTATRKGVLDPKKDRLCRQAQRWIDRWMDANEWPVMEQEIVRRVDRDGEVFLRFFDIGYGCLQVRFVEPEHVRDEGTASDTTFGIITDPDDIETVWSYRVVTHPAISFSTEDVEADFILHIKCNTDSTAKRGLPVLYPVRKNLERADRLLRNASILAQVRATYAVIRKHTGVSAAAISAFQQNSSTFQTTNPISGQTDFQKQLLPGGIIDTGAMTEYDFPSAQVEASQFVELLQAELRAIASRLCMPEYLISSDASNANYASTLVAESPWVKHAERMQAFFGRKFGVGVYAKNKKLGVLWRVLECGVRAGKLPSDVLRHIDIQGEGPSLVVRDRLQEAQRNQILHQNKVLSITSWQASEGLDPSVEDQLLKAEQPEPQSQLQPPTEPTPGEPNVPSL